MTTTRSKAARSRAARKGAGTRLRNAVLRQAHEAGEHLAAQEFCPLCPKPDPALLDSEAYADSPEGATALWQAGFRPHEASEVREGMLVAYVTTMFGVTADKQVRYGRVLRVEVIQRPAFGNVRNPVWIDEVEIAHTTEDGGDSVVECDPENEVWAQEVQS